MKVLGISGSPHENGSTAYALQHALEMVEAQAIETAYITLAGTTIVPCDGCLACRKGACVHDDDMAPIYQSIQECDGLILASPVYMGQVSGQLKVMMDRTVIARTASRFALSGKVGAGIACGAFRNGGQELTLQTMHTFFLQQDMLVVSDGPGFSHSGATIVGKAGEDRLGLKTVENLALRMVRALQERGAR